MCLIASRNAVSEIAEMMPLGVTTLSTDRARILEKMNLKNTAELTPHALPRGLVS